jgi:hypothetical protein
MSQSIDVDTLNYSANQLYIYGTIVVIVTGLFGNTLNIIVFSAKLKDSVCPFYLLAVDVFNIAAILMYDLTDVTQLIYGKNGSESSVAWCRVINYVGDVSIVFISFALCLASVDRYVSSCRQASRRLWSSVKVAKVSLVSALLVSSLLAIPDLIYWYIDSDIRLCVAEAFYYEYMSYFLYPVMVSFIPVLILSISGYMTYQNLQTTIYPTSRASEHTRKRRIDHQMARMLLTQILCYSIQTTMLFIIYIYVAQTLYWEKSDMRIAVENLIQAVVYVIFSTAQCTGFYIYYSQSAAFRGNVKRIFMRNRRIAVGGISATGGNAFS